MKKMLFVFLILCLLAIPTRQVEAGPKMAQTIPIPENLYTPEGSFPPGEPAGRYVMTLNTLPTTSDGMVFFLNYYPGNPQDVVTHLAVEYSRDNGATWIPLMEFDATGAAVIDKFGNPTPYLAYGLVTWPGDWSTNVRVPLKGTDVRVVMQVLQAFTTSGVINNVTKDK